MGEKKTNNGKQYISNKYVWLLQTRNLQEFQTDRPQILLKWKLFFNSLSQRICFAFTKIPALLNTTFTKKLKPHSK